MSTYWDVWCLDCEEKAGIGNHQRPEELAALCRHARALALMAYLDEEDAVWSLGVSLGQHISYVPLRWFRKHANHQLAPRNEYGVCLDECGESIACAECGARSRKCRLPLRHEGEHSPERSA